MSVITDHQRRLLVERIAQTLLFARAPSADQSWARTQARAVVDSLEMAAHHGAALKRGADRLIHEIEEVA